MATLSMKTMMATLLAGSLALGAGGMAYAKTDGTAFDPAKFQQRIEQRVGKALAGTDASVDQKKQVADIMASTFRDMKPLRDQRIENRKAMQEALQAPTIDPAKIEAIRTEQMRVADQSSKVFTKGLTDAGKVLSAEQRQAFFKNWNSHERHGHHHGKRG
jgi:Spy/CpxP family protein refolding chaperone